MGTVPKIAVVNPKTEENLLKELQKGPYGRCAFKCPVDGLINTLYDMITGKTESVTSLDESLECHLMGIAAEESRKDGGKLKFVHI